MVDEVPAVGGTPDPERVVVNLVSCSCLQGSAVNQRFVAMGDCIPLLVNPHAQFVEGGVGDGADIHLIIQIRTHQVILHQLVGVQRRDIERNDVSHDAIKYLVKLPISFLG